MLVYPPPKKKSDKNLIMIKLLINVREYRKGNQKWEIQRNGQHRVHKAKKTKKQKHNTICAGHYYMQTNTNNVNKT
jgi:hypothetical protein